VITGQQIGDISQFIIDKPLSEELVRELRSNFPEIHFTYCMDDDVMAGNPVFESPAFNLYLIDSSNHCLSFTQDLEIATGVVLAELEDE
jgi:hypothetical protein